MTATGVYLHIPSGFYLGWANFDGHGRTNFEDGFYDYVGGETPNPNLQLNYKLKPDFKILVWSTNRDNFANLGGNPKRYIVDEVAWAKNMAEINAAKDKCVDDLRLYKELETHDDDFDNIPDEASVEEII